MSSPYTQQVLKVIVAQVCQTIGWNSIQSTPLELLGDILHKYLQEITHQTHRYSELCNYLFYFNINCGKFHDTLNILFRWPFRTKLRRCWTCISGHEC